MSTRNRPAGAIYSCAMQLEAPSFVREQKRTGRRAQGMRYERLGAQEFAGRYPGYLPSPWFRYYDREGEKWCQADGLLINPWQGQISICEFKYQHTEAAHYQLFQVYLPVVAALFAGPYRIACVEVCKWFDPAILCPESPHLCKDPSVAQPGRFNVHIWKPGD